MQFPSFSSTKFKEDTFTQEGDKRNSYVVTYAIQLLPTITEGGASGIGRDRRVAVFVAPCCLGPLVSAMPTYCT